MLRMIIADDEKIIRETIHNFIDWKSLGIEIVGVCKNGLEAYDAIIDEYPDIVLTDIKMPGLSGLELIEKLTQTHEHIQFIILSGYGEFEYAKKAMRFGIKHYLLKPCNEQQIIAAVEDVKCECLKNPGDELPAEFEKSLFRTLLTEGILSDNSINDSCECYIRYLDFGSIPYGLHYFYFLEEENLMECALRISHYMDLHYPDLLYHMIYVKNTLLLIIKNYHQEFASNPDLKRLMDFPTQTVQVSYENSSCANLSDLYRILMKKLKRFDKIFYLDGLRKIPVYNYGSCLNAAQNACRKYRENGQDSILLKQELTELLSSVQDKDFLTYLLADILLKQSQHLSGTAAVSLTEFFTHMNQANDIHEITNAFFANFDTYFPSSTCMSYKPFIEKLLAYMEEHLSDPNLSLKWVAGNFLYMNVDYVSKQFLKQTGEKFSHYLNKMRINRAKALLLDCDSEKIYTIAEQVGCGNNPQYFSQLFKKYAGMTPTEYMKKMTGRE